MDFEVKDSAAKKQHICAVFLLTLRFLVPAKDL